MIRSSVWAALIRWSFVTLLMGMSPLGMASESAPQAVNGVQMMANFDRAQAEKDDGVTPVNEHTRRIVMFSMGIPLILLVLTTGAIGIAVGVYQKPWFLAHMILAGLTMTLALAHAIVGIAWYFPF